MTVSTSIFTALFIVTMIRPAFGQPIVVHGHIQYYDAQLGTNLPLVNAEVRIETYNPTTNPAPTVYTNDSGFFSSPVSGYPDQVTVRVFFRNPRIDLRGATTTRSDIGVWSKRTYWPGCPNPNVPCDFFIPGDEYQNVQFVLTSPPVWCQC